MPPLDKLSIHDLASPLVLLLVLTSLQLFSRYVLRYRLTDRHFQFVVFGIVIREIGLEEIARASVFDSLSLDSFSLNIVSQYPNRLFTRFAVIIEKKRGFPRSWIITPDDSKAFVEAFRRLKACS